MIDLDFTDPAFELDEGFAGVHQPSKRLIGFSQEDLQSGQSQRVSVTIDCTASNHPFSYFKPADELNLEVWANGDWVTPNGQFTVRDGSSSAQPPLQSPVALNLAGFQAWSEPAPLGV